MFHAHICVLAWLFKRHLILKPEHSCSPDNSVIFSKQQTQVTVVASSRDLSSLDFDCWENSGGVGIKYCYNPRPADWEIFPENSIKIIRQAINYPDWMKPLDEHSHVIASLLLNHDINMLMWWLVAGGWIFKMKSRWYCRWVVWWGRCCSSLGV